MKAVEVGNIKVIVAKSFFKIYSDLIFGKRWPCDIFFQDKILIVYLNALGVCPIFILLMHISISLGICLLLGSDLLTSQITETVAVGYSTNTEILIHSFLTLSSGHISVGIWKFLLRVWQNTPCKVQSVSVLHSWYRV